MSDTTMIAVLEPIPLTITDRHELHTLMELVCDGVKRILHGPTRDDDKVAEMLMLWFGLRARVGCRA